MSVTPRAVTMLSLLVCAIAAVPAHAQVPVADGVFSRDVYPERRVSFPGGVVGLPDVAYGSVSGFRRLTLDLYVPPASIAGPYPVIVYLHGGGWRGGTPRTTGAFEDWPEVLASFAARGYVVASVDYRLSGESPFPAAIQDVKSAIRWLRTNATTYGIDPGRFLTWGVSAGGQLAGLAATACDVAELEPPAGGGRGGGAAAPPSSTCVQGSVLWYTVSNLEMTLAAAGDAAAGGGRFEYLGCAPPDCAAPARAATVNTYVDASDPPMLLIHGTADTTVSVDQSTVLDALLRAHGIRSELVVLPDIGHSFIGPTGDATRAASRAALERTVAFIDATIGPGAR